MAVQARHHGRGVERGPVVEEHALAHRDGHRQAVLGDLRHRGRQLRDERPFQVDVVELLAHVDEDLARACGARERRVEGVRVLELADVDLAAALRILRAGTHREQETRQTDGEPHREALPHRESLLQTARDPHPTGCASACATVAALSRCGPHGDGARAAPRPDHRHDVAQSSDQPRGDAPPADGCLGLERRGISLLACTPSTEADSVAPPVERWSAEGCRSSSRPLAWRLAGSWSIGRWTSTSRVTLRATWSSWPSATPGATRRASDPSGRRWAGSCRWGKSSPGSRIRALDGPAVTTVLRRRFEVNEGSSDGGAWRSSPFRTSPSPPSPGRARTRVCRRVASRPRGTPARSESCPRAGDRPRRASRIMSRARRTT